MKLKINKNIRLALTIIIVIASILFAYLTYNQIYNPGFEEKTTPVYSYNSKGLINYAVFLKPNNLYTQSRLKEGKLYITEFVDYVDVNLKYEFTGETDAEIKGNYNIIAKVKGFTGEGEKSINIWEKDFPITDYKRINTNDGKVSINENVTLNLSEYNIFVNEIKEATKINCQTSLTLSMNVNINGTTDKGVFEELMSPNLAIPLDTLMFEIGGNSIIDKPGSIEETIQVQLSVNRNLIIGYGIILFILVIALIILIFFTVPKPKKDPIEKEINKIFKKHGDRLVALNSDIVVKKTIIVKSIEDLVRISDEIEKPILYKYSEDYRKINKFYVINEDDSFVFDLANLKVFQQIKNDTEKKGSDNTNQNLNEN